MIKATLFDIDGTLIDSNDLHVLAWEEAFAGIGEAFERSTIHDQIGKGADMLIPALLPNADDATRQALDEAHGRIFKKKFLGQARPFAQARDLLQRAHEDGRKVVLASSASAEELDHYVDLLQARDMIFATTSSADVESTKPAPDIFSTALRKLPGIAAQEAVVIGDTPYDIEAARKAGIGTVAVLSGGFPQAVLAGAGPIAIYDDVAALLADYRRSPLAN